MKRTTDVQIFIVVIKSIHIRLAITHNGFDRATASIMALPLAFKYLMVYLLRIIWRVLYVNFPICGRRPIIGQLVRLVRLPYYLRNGMIYDLPVISTVVLYTYCVYCYCRRLRSAHCIFHSFCFEYAHLY